MIIKNILSILRRIDKINTSALFGHYSSKYVWKKIFELEAKRAGWKTRNEIVKERQKEELEKFYKILSFLNKQGFVQKINNGQKRSFWKLTKRGLEKLLLLDVLKDKKLLPMKFNTIEKGDLKIVVFDIPEIFRQYRLWLRQTLINLGFRRLQKSVWIGKTKFPEEFIYNLRKLDLLDCVHIFSVKNEGTLTES